MDQKVNVAFYKMKKWVDMKFIKTKLIEITDNFYKRITAPKWIAKTVKKKLK